MIRSVRNSVIRPSGVRSGVRTGVRELVTGSEGGVLQKSAMFCYIAHFPMLLRCGGLSPTTRPDRAAPAGTCRTGATPPFFAASAASRAGVCYSPCYISCYTPLGSLPSNLSLREGSDPEPQAVAAAPEASPLKVRYPILIVGGLGCSAWGFLYHPFPLPGDDPMLDLVLYHTPNFYAWIVRWYYIAPASTIIVGGLFLISVWRVWFESWGVGMPNIGMLPSWPLSAHKDDGPAIVIGEVHHPVKAIESRSPKWLTIPERGLYTGVAIFGAVGSGKTSACMHPFAQQILSWQARDPQLRAAGLVLEVKGDFCHDIRQILVEAGREEDYIELGMEGRWQWNPLSAEWLDSYSLAYTVSSLLNQLFGKGKEPFWQQAYTNLVRWIIELYRVFPGHWVTLQQVYHCAIDKELFAAKIQEAERYVKDLRDGTLTVSSADFSPNALQLGELGNWVPAGEGTTFRTDYSPSIETRLKRTPDRPPDRVDRERKSRRNSRAGRCRQSLVSTRLADDRQQNPVEHRRGHLGFPVHIRPAGRGAGVLSTTVPEESAGDGER